MESGYIVEYIDRQKILCAVILEVKKRRLRLLTEANREVNLSEKRLLYKCQKHIDLSMGRDKIVGILKDVATLRNALINHIDIKSLWEVLNTEQEWIDLPTMTEFCFPENPSFDHESAVIRAFFNDRLYFKFNRGRFFPYSREQVIQKAKQAKEAVRKKRLVENGANWLKRIQNNSFDLSDSDSLSEDNLEFVRILKSYYLFEKESEHYSTGKEILAKAGIRSVDKIFDILVKLGVFDEDEVIDLHLYDISTTFPERVTKHAASMRLIPDSYIFDGGHKDLTNLNVITIDGQYTLDYDDAISIEDLGDHYRLGIHITDVGYYIKSGDIVDQEALSRGSSIYMPDLTIPMLPEYLAESFCSLRVGQLRPAISIFVKVDRLYNIIDYEVTPGVIQVNKQLTYYDANLMAGEDWEITTLYEIAKKFRQFRLDRNAVQITLPNINIWIDADGEINISMINRESPARMLVSELMILANWLMARFLSENNLPAIYRSQAAPKKRLFKGDEGTLFQNYMQKRLLNRFVLDTRPEHHAGLGLDKYVTATSPIRKYYDLATQRQIRAALGLQEPLTFEEVDNIILSLKEPMGHVTQIQRGRNRYWLLKYLEKRIGQRENAIILYKRKNDYSALIPEYMIECNLPISGSFNLEPEDMVQVTIQNVNARKDIFSVFPG